MTTALRRPAALAALAGTALLLSGCGVNTIPAKEEAVKAKWADVENQYQRRADLIPNLVSTVKGYAAQEKDVLEAVTKARASASQVTVDPTKLSDPKQLAAFEQAQGALGQSLGEDAQQGIREVERVHAHVEQAGDGLCGRVGVQG